MVRLDRFDVLLLLLAIVLVVLMSWTLLKLS
jgi:hypothetical protein